MQPNSFDVIRIPTNCARRRVRPHGAHRRLARSTLRPFSQRWARPKAMVGSTTSLANTPSPPCATHFLRISSSLRAKLSSASRSGCQVARRRCCRRTFATRRSKKRPRPSKRRCATHRSRPCAMCISSRSNAASNQRARPGRRGARQDRRHRERLCVNGLFARRAAIGVAKALGEIGAEVGERQVLKDWTLYSSVASCSAGIELMRNVVILIGGSRFPASPFTIGHAVMRDAIDLPAVMQALEGVGLGALDARSRNRFVNIFAKAEASPGGAIRGLRHTMLEDFGHQRHPARPRGGRRLDRRPVRDRRGLWLRRR